VTILTIIRGPSGTGKSTIAIHLGGKARKNWYEADMYFDRNGHYEFDGSRLGHAHKWCQDQVRDSLRQGYDTIVSNTTIKTSELNIYLRIAEEFDAELQIIRTPRPWNIAVLHNRNVHRVPVGALERMINSYVEYEKEEEWADLSIFND
jgi:predicted kinase